jgi:hypothetical protein
MGTTGLDDASNLLVFVRSWVAHALVVMFSRPRFLMGITCCAKRKKSVVNER